MWVEKAFDLNDWVVLGSIVIVWSLFYLLPKGLLSKQAKIFVFLFSLSISTIFDCTSASLSIDYYDIMDGPKYTVMDLIVYILYMPFSYFFIYLYEFFKIKSYMIILYIIVWSLLSIGVEYFYHLMNVFTYKNGYQVYFSYCVYLTVQTLLLFLYTKIYKSKPTQRVKNQH